MPREWSRLEPGWQKGQQQLVRLLRRARRRPLSVVLLAAATAFAIAAISAVKEQTFSPRFVLRVEETDRDPNITPRPKRRLREYVESAVFSNARLRGVMKRHNLYPALARNNPQAALQSFRDDITVDVYQNYFIEERSAHAPPRSARIAVRYESSDKRVAVAVARDLGTQIIEHEHAMRDRQAARAAREAGRAAARARQAVDQRRDLIAQKNREFAENPNPAAQVELINLTRSLEGLERSLDRAERRKAALQVGSKIEKRGLGLSFNVVEHGAVTVRAGLHPKDLAGIVAIGFFFALPLAAMTIGAFSSTIDELDDLERLGLPALGHLHLSNRSAGGYR